MSRNVILGISAVVILVTLGIWLVSSNRSRQPETTVPAQPTLPTPTEDSSSATNAASEQTIGENIVMITSSEFSPSSITIGVGQSITWSNSDNKPHQVSSALHPTHTLYPLINKVGVLQPEESKSLTFPEVGTYKYHDHLNPSLTGTIIVQ